MKTKSLFTFALLCAVAQGAWAQEPDWKLVGSEEFLNRYIQEGEKYIQLVNDIKLTENLEIGQDNIPQSVTIDLNGWTLSRNLSAVDDNGQVIKVLAYGTLTLQSSQAGGTISGGWAKEGGGIFNLGTLELDNVNITNCKGTDGGGIYNYLNSTVSMTNCSITGCRSNAGGGAFVNYGTAEISGCTMSNNVATTRGGAIWTNTSLSVTNSTFTGNEALAIGGSNQNEGDGGAIHVNGGTATLNGVTITGNKSKDAGAIYVASGATLNLGGTSTLTGNTSSEHGGGAIVNQGTTALSGNVSITGNTCKTNGGGIWNNATLKMEGNVTVKNNTRDDIYLKSGKVITLSGAITSGANSIGIAMETSIGTFTSGYPGSGTTTNPFFSETSNTMIVDDGELKLVHIYYECSWNSTTKEVVRTPQTLSGTNIKNICTETYSGVGEMNGSNYVYIAFGKATIAGGLTVRGDCKLILCDGAEVTVNGAGIEVKEGATLSIYAQSEGESTGKLIVRPTSGNNAGIGSKGDQTAGGTSGNIVIHGGYVEAHGGQYGAGIGGGQRADGANVTIYNGTVKAYGGEGGAGIGTGLRKTNAKDIIIYGGSVTAEGGLGGAGIGCGDNDTDNNQNAEATSGSVTIYGGTVTAQAGSNAAGIGGGCICDGITVTISGGNITAKGSNNGAGIGGTKLGKGGDVTIQGGKTYAYGGKYAAGIGGGQSGNGGTLTVDAGYVYAKGGDYAAGIGGGQNGNGASVIINGGEIVADGGTDAAGIGSGEEGLLNNNINGGSLTVNGGTVFADGTGWGAGIGGGEDSDGATVVITGGSVTAWAGSDAGSKNGSAIGSEDGDGHRGSLNIGDKMMVHAGQNESDANGHLFSTGERVPACFFRPYTKIEPCNHQGASYTVSGPNATDTHTRHCTHCKANTPEEHTFKNNRCTVCNISGSVSTISIYLPEAGEQGYTDGTYSANPRSTQEVVTGSNVNLPTPPVTHLPLGVEFAGWAIGKPTELSNKSYWKSDDEPIYKTYTVNGDISLTPRYTAVNITLADAADNGEKLYLNNEKTAQKVTLSGRTLYKDGKWNTLCLPFSMRADQVANDLAGATLMTLSGSSFNAQTGELTIEFATATTIEAGKPYIVKWEESTNVENPVFNSVVINNTPQTVTSDCIDFIGTFSPEIIYQADGKTRLFLGDGNTLYYPESEGFKVNACRGYFELKGLTAGALSEGGEAPPVRSFNLNFDDEAAGISEAVANSTLYTLHSTLNQWYTLDGRRLTGKPTARGLYFNNGKKVIIK